jgi:hypothetical protein
MRIRRTKPLGFELYLGREASFGASLTPIEDLFPGIRDWLNILIRIGPVVPIGLELCSRRITIILLNVSITFFWGIS